MFKVVQPLSRLRSALPGTFILLSSAFLLTACIVTADQSIEGSPKDPRAQDIADKIRSLDLEPRQTTDAGAGGIAQPKASKPAIYLSDGSTPQGTALAERDDGGGGGYDLNFENAPVATVAKVILGDVLNVGYTIDPRVQGTITLASVRPVPKADALYVLENALRMSGVALVRDRGASYRLIPAPEAGPGGIDRSVSAEAGQGISVVPLRYVSAQNIFKLLDAFGAKASTMRPDNARNTLIVTGSGTDRASAIDTILSFDADWMRGQSVGIIPVRNSSPEPVISEIEKIMDSGEGGLSQSMIKFQPITRLNSILVVSQKPEYLKRAQVWIARLDRSDTDGVNMKAYPLRYGNAKVVVALLNDMLFSQSGTSSSSLDNSSSQISPGSGVSMSSSGPGTNPVASLSALPTAAAGAATPVTGPAGSSLSARPAPAASGVPGQDNTSGSLLGSGSKPPGSAVLQNVRITADVTNNAVLVYANQESQRVVEQTIRQIDRPQRQIAIEATIAEVTLNNQLNYGVQFFLASQKGSVSNTISGISNSATIGSNIEPQSNAVNAAAGALLGRALPGFNFLIGSENSPRVVLDALHNVTDVKVLSNPSLVVLDNQTATLQVGDQVPFSTGTATVLTANNTVVNTIDYKNTGIILRVLPRSNANGNVVLDIEQEISSVAAGSATLTPTISQRRVKSSIAVTSGQTVLLAGLISETENKQRQGLPILDSIPGVGDAFSHQTNARARTELILFIRPTVIKDGVDAHVIAEEMRTKMNSRLVGTSDPVVVVPPKTAR
ncbi:type II secretion system protein GspD [Bradyrhizobium iriomotense]|uniref:Type II secretion system protein GspD n=1 Tax=Bradyrhizobium iriomotense TaxID=441950 RepID=A0ABQ6AV62_9BRAD|nr:type II secretion system protein GspD [Bradyrhizobium iriomotense]